MKEIEKVTSQFAQLMINKIKKIQNNQFEPWLKSDICPRNIRGSGYQGVNLLMLLLHGEEKNFKYPVYLTIKQANERGLSIRKGEKAFIVYFFKKIVVSHDKSKKITYEDYLLLNTEQQKHYKVLPKLKLYFVFNIEQTNIQDADPDLWNSFDCTSLPTFESKCKCIDQLIEANDWLCPIEIAKSFKPQYDLIKDSIQCPTKEEFIESTMFYSSLLHEMAHSTGTKDRLNRDMGIKAYGREELIAELTAAICCARLGFGSKVNKQSAIYLKSWLHYCDQEPEYLQTILTEVGRAYNLISSKISFEGT